MTSQARWQIKRVATAVTCTALLAPSGAHAQQTTITNYEYDAQGNRTKVTDPRSKVTGMAYDTLNRQKQITQPPAAVGGTTPIIKTTYDGLDQITSVIDPRNLTTSYTVDGLGQVSQQVSPDSGTTINTFDAASNLKTGKDARLKTSTYTYDVLNRVTNIAYATGTASVLEYDGGSAPVSNDKGRLTRITDESGSTRWVYDPFGRVLSKTQVTGGTPNQTHVVSYAYGSTGTTTGKLVTVTYPSGALATMTYDASGRVASVTWTASGATSVTLVSNVKYTPFGSASSWTWGNGSLYARTFDLDGRLTTYPLGVVQAGTGPGQTTGALKRTVAYDSSSRITGYAHADTAGSTTSPAAVAANQTFGYDDLDRLTSYSTNSTNQAYGYDLTGNRTTLNVAGTAYTYAVAAASNRLTSTTGPTPAKSNTYDAAGSVTADGTNTWTYSDRGRMATNVRSSNTVSYSFNAIGQRTLKTGPTTIISTGAARYVYDESGHLLGEYDINGQVIEETVWLDDTPIATIRPQGTITIDNTDTANVTAVGAWPTGNTIIGYYGSNYAYHAAAAGTDTFTWKINVATAGSYNVFARWTADPNRSTAAKYTVGTTSVAKNQRLNGGTWQRLGTFSLVAGVNNVVLATDASGAALADAVQAVPTTSGQVIGYIFTDQIGTPRVIVRSTDDKMLWRWDATDPFGNTAPNENPASLGAYTYNLRFPGQLFDKESNLFYNYFRDYDPSEGRYAQSDPIGLNGGINSYLYVSGDPLLYADLFGLTRAQVDAMLERVRCNNTDLNVPNEVDISSVFGGEDTAVTNPITLKITLSSYYNGDLDSDGLNSLYKTLTHESIHRTRPRIDMIKRPFDHPDIYDEAAKRAKEYARTGGKDDCKCK